MGQKNCSLKNEDELSQIIGKYKMTSEFRWMELENETNGQVKTAVERKDSYSSDSLDENCDDSLVDIRKNGASSDEDFENDTNKEKYITCSDISSVNDNTSFISHYCFETVEETESLQTEDIKETVDIRISPRNSTLISSNCSYNFYSDFSLVANVEIENSNNNASVESHLIDSLTVSTNDKHCNINGVTDLVQVDMNRKEDINITNNDIGGTNDNSLCRQNISQNIKNDISSCNARTLANKKNDIPDDEKRIAVEKKIAEEIKELKKREEDLREMRRKLREEMQSKSLSKALNQETCDSVKTVNSVSDESQCENKHTKKSNGSNSENAYVKACVFAIKRKIMPHNSAESSAIIHQESPIEKEIRIAKAREEELKIEREEILRMKLQMESFQSELSFAETDPDSALSICSNSSFDSVSKLAPLFPREESRALTPESVSNPSNGVSIYSSSADSMGSLESLSHPRQNNVEKSTSGSTLSTSPAPRSGTDLRNKAIDMERFISSKGKEIKFKGETGNISTAPYYEIKPPQIKKGEVCKRFITAAAKIQNELKEMEEREEQLKKERAMLQQNKESQKNFQVSVIGNEEQILKSDMPQENDLGQNEKQEMYSNQGRRRSALIEEWELRIQKSISQS